MRNVYRGTAIIQNRRIGTVDVLHTGYPFVYTRGGNHLIVTNPRREPARFDISGLAAAATESAPRLRTLAGHGVRIVGREVEAAGFSYGVFEIG